MTLPGEMHEELAEGIHCPGCGYELRGSAGERCPECGLQVDATPVQLAWERQGEIGRWRAFARTAWLASVHPDRLARVIAGRVDVRSARRFRRLLLAIVLLMTSAAFVAVVGRTGGPARFNRLSGPSSLGVTSVNVLSLFWSAGAMLWPVLPIGLAVALFAGTRWDHWFVLPDLSPARRNRAMAAARYAVAPMLGVGCVVAATAAWWAAGVEIEWMATSTERGLKAVATLLAGIVLVLTATAPARYAAALPGGGGGRFVLVLAGTAAQWVIALAVGVGLFPAVVGFAVVVIDSLR